MPIQTSYPSPFHIDGFHQVDVQSHRRSPSVVNPGTTSPLLKDQTIVKTFLNRFRRIAKPTPHNPRNVGLRDSQLGGWNLAEIGQLADGFTITAEDTVIDVGCGEGGTANFAAGRGAEVIATDIDEAMVAKARRKLEKSKARKFEAVASDSNPLPFEDERVTKVICMEVMEHVQDPQQFISELVRIGKPGAQYLLTVPDPAS